MKKITLLHLFILETRSILESRDQTGHIHFDHAYPKYFWSAFNFWDHVSTGTQQILQIFIIEQIQEKLMTKFFFKIKKILLLDHFPSFFVAKKLSQNIQHPKLDKGFYYHAEIKRNLMIQFQENTSSDSRMEGQIDPIS